MKWENISAITNIKKVYNYLEQTKKYTISYTVEPEKVDIIRIKPEMYKSLEIKCLEIRKMMEDALFSQIKYHLKEITLDFLLASDNTFKFLQIKDYIAASVMHQS